MKYLILIASLFLINCAKNNSSKSATANNSCGNKPLFSYWANEDGTTELDFRTYTFGDNEAYYTHEGANVCKFTITFSGSDCEGVYSTTNSENISNDNTINCKEIIPDRNGEYKKDSTGLLLHNITENMNNFYK